MGGVKHVHAIGEGFVQRVIPQDPAELQHFLIRLIIRIAENSPGQQIVFPIGGIQLAAQGTVHIEGGDPISLRNKVGRRLVGHVFHVFDERLQRRSVRIPFRKNGFPFFRKCRKRGKRQHKRQQQSNPFFHPWFILLLKASLQSLYILRILLQCGGKKKTDFRASLCRIFPP